MKIGTGWREREAAAKAALAARDGGYNLTQTEKEKARSAMIQAQADAAKAHKEAQDRLHRETVTVCPCCAGKGHLPVIEAAAALEGIESYKRVGWSPNAYSISRVSKDSFTVDKDGNRVTETAPLITVEDDAAGSDDDALAAIQDEPVKPAKPPRRHVVPPFLDGDEP